MPSPAFNGHLQQLLADADHLIEAHDQLPIGYPGRPARRAALNRGVVVICLSAWEAYIEELTRLCLELLRPAGPALGVWPALNATVRGQLGRFNTPSTDNIRFLLSDAIGLADVHKSWAWQNSTSEQSVHRLAHALELRHRIAHETNPRPLVDRFYATRLPEFFRRLGQCTDRAVRDHFILVHSLLIPWPP